MEQLYSFIGFMLYALQYVDMLLSLFILFWGGGVIENRLVVTENISLKSILLNTFIMICALFIILFMMLYVTNSISKSHAQDKSELLKKQIDIQNEYHNKAEKLNSNLRDFRHDYENHIKSLRTLLEQGNSEDLRQYLSEISGLDFIDLDRFSSGNQLADALLSIKDDYAAKAGATIVFNGKISKDISNFDLCTILSNALDNAIEACAKIHINEQKVIKVKCQFSGNNQSINITNLNYEANASFETTKKDKINHGYGLQKIRRTVEGYGGYMKIISKTPVFELYLEFSVKSYEDFKARAELVSLGKGAA